MKYRYIVIVLLSIVLFACDKGSFEKEMNHSKRVYISLKDKEGNNLLETSGLQIDTVSVGARKDVLVIAPTEYTLLLFVNGEKKEGALDYYLENLKPSDCLIFCYPEGEGDKLGKKDYVFEYHFCCPKMFGDDQAKVIKVELPFRNGCHPITAIYWEGSKIAGESSGGRATVVLR